MFHFFIFYFLASPYIYSIWSFVIIEQGSISFLFFQWNSLLCFSNFDAVKGESSMVMDDENSESFDPNLLESSVLSDNR